MRQSLPEERLFDLVSAILNLSSLNHLILPAIPCSPQQAASQADGPRSTKQRHTTRWRENVRLGARRSCVARSPRTRILADECQFACFLPPDQCDRVFLTPASRRKHLIAKHSESAFYVRCC